MLNKIMEKEYTLLIDTLNLLILPEKEIGISYISSIQYKLDELEGDYYTFFHKDNILRLVPFVSLSKETIYTFDKIRIQISEIEKQLWNPLDFINNVRWQNVRNEVLRLFEMDLIR
jgi:hypothetical protein